MIESCVPRSPAYSVFGFCAKPCKSIPTRSCMTYAVKTRRNPQPSDDDGDDNTDEAAHIGRREFMMYSVVGAALGVEAAADMGMDGRTVLNSILGAYGLPQVAATKGYRVFDDFNEEYSFSYPIAWVQRRNQLRSGIYIANFQTADKLSVETLSLDGGGGGGLAPGTQQFAEAVVSALLNPAGQAGGDSRIEMPPISKIKWESQEIDGVVYTYIRFPSETITRSGYQVRRKNLAVAASKCGVAYCLGTSARSDQWNPEKEEQLTTIVESFRIR